MIDPTFKITSNKKSLRKLEVNCRKLNRRHIRFGWYEGRNYPASHENKGLSIAQVAYWQEYGMRGQGGKSIPSRPYFRQAIITVQNGYNTRIKNMFLTGIFGNDIDTHLNKIATSIVSDYQKSVALQNHEKLSDVTVKIKGHSYQMLDSGVMMANFKARVYKQKQEHIKDN